MLLLMVALHEGRSEPLLRTAEGDMGSSGRSTGRLSSKKHSTITKPTPPHPTEAMKGADSDTLSNWPEESDPAAAERNMRDSKAEKARVLSATVS